jgi:MiaB-like tRNA modifying enzyme
MKVFIRTFGCSANLNDAEIMAGLLRKRGCKIVDSPDKAGVVVLNTCIVKGATEHKVVKEIKKVVETKKRLVVAGCMPSAEYSFVKELAPKASLVSPHHVDKIVEAVNAKKEFVGKRNTPKLNLPKQRRNPVINTTQLSVGCLGSCSYCVVKLAKGGLFSYDDDAITNDVECAVREGCKEIWLTSQDNAAYGFDRKTSLADLLRKITALKGDFKVRVGMMNPDNALLILSELVKVYRNDKIFKFLHLPVQSGNDEVLKRMNRQYSVAQFKKIIRNFRRHIPQITIATDVIVGFPGETEHQFEDSLRLIKEIKPDVLNTSRFWPRPGTAAAAMKEQIRGNVTKERSRRLTSEFEKIALGNNMKWVGWRGKVLVDKKGRNSSWVSRNFAYKPVIVHSDADILGKELVVEVGGVTNHVLLAENKQTTPSEV